MRLERLQAIRAVTQVIIPSSAELLEAASLSFTQTPAASERIDTVALDHEVRTFFDREMTAHVAAIQTLDPPPERVFGALTTGAFSWGTFMRALAAYAKLANTLTIAGRDVLSLIAKMGLIEARQGGKSWAQLHAAFALESFGMDLEYNALWQGLSPEEKTAWLSLLDPERFYDIKKHKPINLPENYFGVAARIAAMSYQLGLTSDRAYVNDLLDRAAHQFTSGNLYADDALPTGRFDRYSNEYSRAVYEAAVIANRQDIVDAVTPAVKEDMRLWWDLLAPDGYGHPWGRTLGAIGYMDTIDITAFLAKHPEFRPASLPQIAATYYAAWRWLRKDFKDKTHLLSVFAFGRGNYAYISKEREWQQTTGFFVKGISGHQMLMAALAEENVASFPSTLHLQDVARFVYFRKDATRQYGVWVIRQGLMRFALPFVTGPVAALSDYEPAPHGLPGLAVPVEKVYPVFVPFLELETGQIIATADGADEIIPASDGRSVTAVWKRWVVVPGPLDGQIVDPGLTAEVTWSLTENTLRRSETITALRSVTVRRWWMAMPSRADRLATSVTNGVRTDRLISKEAVLDVRIISSDWPIAISAWATGDSPLGKGTHGSIPLHVLFESNNISFAPGTAQKWSIEITSFTGSH